MGEVFDLILVHPIINILVGVYKALFFLHIPYALGFAIIILTIIIRFVMYPLISSQLKSSKKMQSLSPHLSKIKDRHKGDAKKLQAETMRLYKEHGINPAAGCLPVIIQLPIIWALYSVLQKIVGFNPKVVVLEINKIVYFDFIKLGEPWDPYFFGLPLGQNPSQIISSIGPLVLLIPFATGFFQFIQSKMMINKPEAPKDAVSRGAGSASGGIKTDKKKEDFATAFQTQSLYIFPVMIGFFSFNFPVGLSLYWNTFTIFGIIQQYKISGLGGLKGWVNKIHG